MKYQKEEIQHFKSKMVSLANSNKTHQEISTPNQHDNRMLLESSKIISPKTFTEKQNDTLGRVKRQVDVKDTFPSTSWMKLEILDRVIGYMDYETYTIKIYDHTPIKEIHLKNEDKKYYFEPIGQLNQLSAQSAFNNISRKPEMTFNVNMWSDTVRNAVL